MQKQSNKENWILMDLKKPHWRLSPTKNLPAFLRALSLLIKADWIVYFEDGRPDQEIKNFFRDRSLVDRPIIPMGTISPKPAFYHLPASAINLEELAQIAERHSEYEIACHIHVYFDNTVVLQWYDAFSDPIYVSDKIIENKIKSFCDRLTLRCERELGN